MLKWLKSISKNVNICNTNYFSIDKWGFTQDDGTKRWKVIQKYTLYFWGCISLFSISKRKMYVHCMSFSNTFSTSNQKRKTGAIKQNSLESVPPLKPNSLIFLAAPLHHSWLTAGEYHRIALLHKKVLVSNRIMHLDKTPLFNSCQTASIWKHLSQRWISPRSVCPGPSQRRVASLNTDSFFSEEHSQKHKFNMHLLIENIHSVIYI